MRLVRPKEINKNNPQPLPTQFQSESGYLVIGLVQDLGTFYVAFIDQQQENLWIEKVNSPTLKNSFIKFEDLVKIEDDEEWKAVRDFLIKKTMI